MAPIGFIGLGNMGGPTARNLIDAGHELKVYDLSEQAVQLAAQSGATAVASVQEAASDGAFAMHIGNGFGDLDTSSIVKLLKSDL